MQRLSYIIRMTHFTPLSALAGGAMIGLSATAFWFLNGRVAGVSGVFGDFVLGRAEARAPKGAFIAGMLVAAVLLGLFSPASFGASPRSIFTLGIAGLFVGVGTRMGNGCTSGHGVCGISRFSLRSVVATMTFMLVAGLTVLVVDHVWRIS